MDKSISVLYIKAIRDIAWQKQRKDFSRLRRKELFLWHVLVAIRQIRAKKRFLLVLLQQTQKTENFLVSFHLLYFSQFTLHVSLSLSPPIPSWHDLEIFASRNFLLFNWRAYSLPWTFNQAKISWKIPTTQKKYVHVQHIFKYENSRFSTNFTGLHYFPGKMLLSGSWGTAEKGVKTNFAKL